LAQVPQSAPVATWQVPPAAHRPVKQEPLQLAAGSAWPAATLPQAPFAQVWQRPLQPVCGPLSLPHAPVEASQLPVKQVPVGHRFPGSVPVAAAAHTPEALHARQVPVHPDV